MFSGLVLLIVGILLIGLLMFLANRAPFIDADAKAIVHWILLVVLVLYAAWGICVLFGVTTAPFALPGRVR